MLFGFFFFNKFIYFWLHWVFVVVCRFLIVVASLVVEHGLLGTRASVVVAHGL